jgi:hypothetical protein
MDHNAAPLPPEPVPELIQYGASPPVEVFKTPNDTFDVSALAQQHAADPIAQDTGAVVISTRSVQAGPDGHHIRERFVLDDAFIADPKTGQVQRLADVGDMPPVTIGLNWRSPFEPSRSTYPVEWVMRPHTHGTDGNVTPRPEMPNSPSLEGRAWLRDNVYRRR